MADKGYDSGAPRRNLRAGRVVPVIPGRVNRKRKISYDKARYRDRRHIENAFCRLEDFRRVATRHGKLTNNVLSSVALATLLAYWL